MTPSRRSMEEIQALTGNPANAMLATGQRAKKINSLINTLIL